MMKTTALLTIAQAADTVGLSVHTLRYYERIGLLGPLARASSGHRRFEAGDLAWLEFLIRLRTTGMSIGDMCRFATLRRQGPKSVGLRRRMLEAHAKAVEQRLASLSENLRIVRDKIEYYRALEAPHDER